MMTLNCSAGTFHSRCFHGLVGPAWSNEALTASANMERASRRGRFMVRDRVKGNGPMLALWAGGCQGCASRAFQPSPVFLPLRGNPERSTFLKMAVSTKLTALSLAGSD